MNAEPLAREQGAVDAPGRALTVRRLELTDIRNYRQLTLRPRAGPIVLHGANSAGKTNLLEAVSMLSPGRGLRSAKLAELDRAEGGNSPLRDDVDSPLGLLEIETAHDRSTDRQGVSADGRALRGQNALGEF